MTKVSVWTKPRTAALFLAAIFCLFLLYAIYALSTTKNDRHAKQLVGRVEKARIYPGGLLLRAKLDTGSKDPSLNARRMAKFKKNGQDWVRFEVTNHLGETTTIERRVVRYAKMKQHGNRIRERPVIRLGICLGNTYKEAEVNLADREGFNYPLLIGRSFMRGRIIVDPDLKYTTNPMCRGIRLDWINLAPTSLSPS